MTNSAIETTRIARHPFCFQVAPDTVWLFWPNGPYPTLGTLRSRIQYTDTTPSYSTIQTDFTNLNDSNLWDLCYDGSYFHLVYTPSTDSSNLYYARGTPNLGSETISWSTPQKITNNDVYTSLRPKIVADSDGHPYVVYVTAYNGAHVKVTRSSRNDDTWSTASGFPYTVTTSTLNGILTSACTIGNDFFVAWLSAGSSSALYARAYIDGAWEDEDTSVLSSFNGLIDMIGYQGVCHIATADSTNGLYHWTFDGTTLSGDSQLDSGGGGQPQFVNCYTELHIWYLYPVVSSYRHPLYKIKDEGGGFGGPSFVTNLDCTYTGGFMYFTLPRNLPGAGVATKLPFFYSDYPTDTTPDPDEGTVFTSYWYTEDIDETGFDGSSLSSSITLQDLSGSSDLGSSITLVASQDLSSNFSLNQRAESLSANFSVRNNWLPGWPHRKIHIVVGSPNAGTNYQVRIHVHRTVGADSSSDMYAGTSCRADFADIRFTKGDGVTELNHFLLQIENSVATFYVKIEEDLSQNQPIFIYYGRPNASSASNFESTFTWSPTGFTDDLSKYKIGDNPNTDDWEIEGTDGTNTISIQEDPGDSSKKVIRIVESGDSVATRLIGILGSTPKRGVQLLFRVRGDDTDWYLASLEGDVVRVDFKRDSVGDVLQWHNGTQYNPFSPALSAPASTWMELIARMDTLLDDVSIEKDETTGVGGIRSSPDIGVDTIRFQPDPDSAQTLYVGGIGTTGKFIFAKKFVSSEPGAGSWKTENTGLDMSSSFDVRVESASLSSSFTTQVGDINLSSNVTPYWEITSDYSDNLDLLEVYEVGTADLSSSFFAVKSDSDDLSSSFSVRNSGSADLSSSFSTSQEETVDLSSNFSLPTAGTKDLSSSFTVQKSSTVALSSSFTVQKADGNDLSSSVTLQKSATSFLSSSVTLQKSGYVDVSSSITLQKSSTEDLSSSVTLQKSATASLSSSITLQLADSSALSSSVTVQKASTVYISSSVSVQKSSGVDVSSSFTVQKSGSSALSSNFTIQEQLVSNLSSSVTLQKDSSVYVSSSVTIQKSSSVSLSSSVTLKKSDSESLSSNVTLLDASSSDLPSSVTLLSESVAASLSSSFTIQKESSATIGSSVTIQKESESAVSSSVSIQKFSSSEIPSSFTIQKSSSVALSSSVTLQKSSTDYLPSSFTIRKQTTDALSSSVTLQKASSDILSSSFTVQKSSSSALSSSVTLHKASSFALASNFTIQKSSSLALSSNFSLQKSATAYLSSSVTIRKSTGVNLSSSVAVQKSASVTLPSSFTLNYYWASLSSSLSLGGSQHADLSTSLTVRQITSDALSSSFTIQRANSQALSSSFVPRVTHYTDLSSSVTLQKTSSDSASSSVTLQKESSNIISSSFTIQTSDAQNLSSSITLQKTGYTDFSSSFTIQKLSDVEASSSFTVQKASSLNLSTSVTLQKSGTSALSSSVALSEGDSTSLSSSFTLNYSWVSLSSNITLGGSQTANLSTSVTIRKVASTYLSSSFVMQRADSESVSSSLTVRHLDVTSFSSSVTVQKSSGVDIPGSLTIQRSSFQTLSTTFTVQQLSVASLSASITLQESDAADLSFSITVQSSGVATLSSSITLGGTDSTYLSSSITLPTPGSASLSANIFIPTASARLPSSFRISRKVKYTELDTSNITRSTLSVRQR